MINPLLLRRLPLRLIAAGAITLSVPLAAFAGAVSEEPSQGQQATAGDLVVSPVVVTATRTEQNSFDLPMSIDSVSGEVVREGQLQVNLSESAVRVPGVIVNNRNNPAQDLAIQVRGFGARSAFGVRGVRLYADGIPMTMPDGQGQTGTFNLDTASRIEYLRGPFSALYGNSSGGVVQIFTQDGPDNPTVSGGYTIGSDNTRRSSLTLGGDNGALNYVFNASAYRSDGYRDYSGAERNTYHGKLSLDISESTKLTVVATKLDQPDNDDPQGLTNAELHDDRTQASANALLFKTRVSRSHEQVGASLDHLLTQDDLIKFTGYYGRRDNEQFLSSSVRSQTDTTNGDLNGGGVSTIEREFGGADLRWNHKGKVSGKNYDFTVGVNYDSMNDDRKGYENFIANAAFGTVPMNQSAGPPPVRTTCGDIVNGEPVICGVKGNLRRDEANKVHNFDQYLQASLELAPRWTLNGGLRHSKVKFETIDHYIADSGYGGTNPDDSGEVTYSDTTPVAGVIFKLTDAINLYANAGESFETPTTVEMAYNPDSTKSGLNLDLKPSKSRQYEIGAKAMLGSSTLVNLAIFKIDTEDEIVVATSQAGRTTYRNVPSSERKGLELSVDSKLPGNFGLYMSYSLLDAEFDADFEACKIPSSAQPPGTCRFGNAGDVEKIASGSKIPGTYRYSLYGEASWKHQPSGFSTALEMRKMSDTYVNFNPDNGKADNYSVFSWRGGLTQSIRGWRLSEYVRVENLFDQKYAGAVRVADVNERFYEPAPTRNWLFGVNASYQF